MSNSTSDISKALLDLAAAAETVLYTTAKGRDAEKNPKLASAQRSLLERIDGFRSLEQLLAMSGDLIGVHAALGTLMASGCVSTDPKPQVEAPVIAAAPPPVVRTPAPAKPAAAAARPPAAAAQAAPAPVARAKAPAPAPAKTVSPPSVPTPSPVRANASPAVQAAAIAFTELDNAKRVLSHEAKMVFGNSAAKVQPRIDACRSIEEIYDLIVKFQQHLANTGKANPDVFLDRLTQGIASARKQASATKQAPAR